MNDKPTSHWPFVAALLLVLLVAAGLRLYRLPELPLGLHYDEAANGILAGEIARGVKRPVFIPSYTGKEVLFFYWAALWMKLLGTTPLALRLSAALVGIATVAATVWAVRELLPDQRGALWVALLTAAFVATSSWHLVLSRYGFRAVTQPLLQTLTVAALWRGLRTGKRGWLLLAGLFCGLTAHTYLAARAFPIPLAAALLTLLVADRSHRRARLGQLAPFFAVAALVLAPLACYWLIHPGSFITRTQQVAATSWSEAWAGFRACLGMFFLRGDPYIRFNLPHRPLFDPVTAALFLLGLATLVWQFIGLSRNTNRASVPLPLASRVFLLTYLPVMLLPSALATGEITPSNLRTVGLLPFVYVFPALGAASLPFFIEMGAASLPFFIKMGAASLPFFIKMGAASLPFFIKMGLSNLKHQISDSQFQNSRRPSLPIVHLSLFVLLLVALTCPTAIAYFRAWAPSAALYYAADGDLADSAAYLNQADLTDTTPYIASIHYRHPTLAFLADDYARVRWLTGGRTIVLPAEGEGLLILPRSASKDLAWARSMLPDDALVAAPYDPDGAPAFHVYRIGETHSTGSGQAHSPTPTHPLVANLGHVARLLGYDVMGKPRSGGGIDVAVWWKVLNVPDQGDYGPVARLADPWGSIWGETQPFHYPSEQWTPGEVAIDHLSIPVAPGAPPGDYMVRFSLYSPDTDSLLPVLDETGTYAGTYVELPVRMERAASQPVPDDLDIRTRLNVHTGGLTLLGVNLDTTSIRPGGQLYLTLFWRADAASLPDYDVHLSLGDAMLYEGAPVHGTYPTSDWSAGEIVADRHDPRLPLDTQPGDYPLRLRVGAPSTGSGQAPSTGPSTSSGQRSGQTLSLDLGIIVVQATDRAFEVPPISHPLTATLGDQVQLLGYNLPAGTVRPGETLTLTLYWRALTEIEEDYTVFTHLLAPSTGSGQAPDSSMTGQRDNQPVGGTYPTNLWLTDEVVTDVYEIPVRANAAPGEHRLEVGMYVAETGARLPVVGTADDAIILQEVTITGD